MPEWWGSALKHGMPISAMARWDRLDVAGSGSHKALTLLLEAGSQDDICKIAPVLGETALIDYVRCASKAGEYRPLARILSLEPFFPDNVIIEARDRLPAAATAAMISAYTGKDIRELEKLKRLCEGMGSIEDGDRGAYRELARKMLEEQMKADYSGFVKKVPAVLKRMKLKR
jgi:hypothetical protein